MRKVNRIWIVAPMRAHTRTVKAIFENGPIDTYLEKNFPTELNKCKTLEEPFGIVAGTGVGKTVFLRELCEAHFGEKFQFDVVTSEDEATDFTWTCPVVIVTSGVAMNYLKSGYITKDDSVIIDEIHQTSEHLELAMALARHQEIKVNWMSATIDAKVYVDYFNTKSVLLCEHKDPDKRAIVETLKFSWGRSHEPNTIVTKTPFIEYYLETMENLKRIASGNHGVAVFLPTRAMCEKYALKYNGKHGIQADFYHGGESADKLYPYMKGTIARPFIIFMTIAGSSSLNVKGLDWVIIHNEMYNTVVNKFTGVKTLSRMPLGPNEILQMAGRVDGRVKNGLVTILTETDVDYQNLQPINPMFTLAGDMEQVALTCARMNINLDELDPIGGIDHLQYNRVWRMLVRRGLIAENNTLTEYGYKVDGFPVSRVWGEHLAQADAEMMPFVMVCACAPTLYNFLNRETHDIKEFEVAGNDWLTIYKIIQHAIDNFGTIRFDPSSNGKRLALKNTYKEWAKEHGIYYKQVDQTLVGISSILRSLDIPIEEVHQDFPDVTPEIEAKFRKLLIKVNAFYLLAGQYPVLRESAELGDNPVAISKVSMLNKSDRGAPKFGTLHSIETKYGITHTMEGAGLTFADVQEVLTGKTIFSAKPRESGDVLVTWEYSGLGVKDLIHEQTIESTLSDSLLNKTDHFRTFLEELQSELAHMLADQLFDDELDEDIMTPEIIEHNKSICRQISDFNQARDFWSGGKVDAGSKEFKNLLKGTKVYSLNTLRQSGLSLRIPESAVPQVEEVENQNTHDDQIFENDPSRTSFGDIFNRARFSSSNRLPAVNNHSVFATLGNMYGGNDELARVKPKKDKGNAQKRKEFKKAIVLQDEIASPPEIPEGSTQERADWLIEQTDTLRAEITKLEAERDQAMSDYQKAYDSKKVTLEYQVRWDQAVKEITRINQEIDKFETEALEIMEKLEAV